MKLDLQHDSLFCTWILILLEALPAAQIEFAHVSISTGIRVLQQHTQGYPERSKVLEAHDTSSIGSEGQITNALQNVHPEGRPVSQIFNGRAVSSHSITSIDGFLWRSMYRRPRCIQRLGNISIQSACRSNRRQPRDSIDLKGKIDIGNSSSFYPMIQHTFFSIPSSYLPNRC